jgi:hypothetical protein
MRKVFALMVVGAALTAFGCAEQDTTAPPANNEAVPADDMPEEGAPVDDTTTTTP